MQTVNQAAALLSCQSRNLSASTGVGPISVGIYNVKGEEPAVLLSLRGASHADEAQEMQSRLDRALQHWRDGGLLRAPTRIEVATSRPVRLACDDNDLM